MLRQEVERMKNYREKGFADEKQKDGLLRELRRKIDEREFEVEKLKK